MTRSSARVAAIFKTVAFGKSKRSSGGRPGSCPLGPEASVAGAERAELRATPTLLVRAGRDATPGLDAGLLRFAEAARGRGLPLTLLDLADAPHAFDLVDDTPATREAIGQVLAFLRRELASG